MLELLQHLLHLGGVVGEGEQQVLVASGCHQVLHERIDGHMNIIGLAKPNDR